MAEDHDIREEPEEEGGLRVEIEPEPASAKPRLRGQDTRTLDATDDEVSHYGKSVQDRIKKLRFAFHEERRVREQKERDLAATTEYTQRLFRENAELKKNVRASENAVVHQAISRVDAEIEQARLKNRQAHESGVSDDIVASNEKLARAVAEKERLSMLKPPPEEETQKADPNPPPQPPPQPDVRTREWMDRNPWWQKPGEEERTAFAIGVHNALLARNVTAVNNPDLYWRTIDERLKAVFPEKNGNGASARDRDLDEGEEERPARETSTSRPLAVAGGTRSNTGATNASRPRVIRLSQSQVRLARTLGLTPEQYAAQVALEQGDQTNAN